MKLVLTLPIANVTVETYFSAMQIVYTSLKNWIIDKLFNDCVVCFVEKELFEKITNEVVVKRIKHMEPCRINLESTF